MPGFFQQSQRITGDLHLLLALRPGDWGHGWQGRGGSRSRLLQVVIYVSDLDDVGVLNKLWDAWVPAGHAPIRACVGVRLGSGCLVEMIVEAAVGARKAVDSETVTAWGNSNGEPGT